MIINSKSPISERQITVPWGTIDDWNILLSPSRYGPGIDPGQDANSVLRVEVSSEPFPNKTGWTVSGKCQIQFGNARGLSRADAEFYVQWLIVAKEFPTGG